MKRFGETRKRKGLDESDTGDKKNKVEEKVRKWLVFFEKNLNRIQNNEREAQERQHNQLMLQNQ